MSPLQSDVKIPRFSLGERVAHWTAALSFLYLALTGLALWTPHLYWLAFVSAEARRFVGDIPGRGF